MDLYQKQFVTVSIATTFFKQAFGARFIMVEWFHSENLVEILNLVLELLAYEICPDIMMTLKQLATVSIATTFFKRSFGARFIIVEWFHSENLVQILNLALEV